MAEVFHTLSALFADRIDLGLARGVGATKEAAALLRDGAPAPVNGAEREALFERKMNELIAHLRLGQKEDRRRGSPAPVSNPPEMWLMGSQTWSAALAAKLGVGLAMTLWYQLPEPVDIAAILSNYAEQFQRMSDGPPASACAPAPGTARPWASAPH